jgi:hypothetical protein
MELIASSLRLCLALTFVVQRSPPATPLTPFFHPIPHVTTGALLMFLRRPAACD